MDGRIFHMKKLLGEMPDREWTIAEMADTLGLSPPHFHKLFKHHTGISPGAYLNGLRLDKARAMLENTFAQVKQIGIKVGIRDDSHLTRGFKNKFGVTPTEYRRRHWERVQAEEVDRGN
jgi:transcriptional regulator GlxA family with amidase domain